MQGLYKTYSLRNWLPGDRQAAAQLIEAVLAEYGLGWEPDGADQDVLAVEDCYLTQGGEFWIIEQAGTLVGTAAYWPTHRGQQAVEIRKMYLHPCARGQGLGYFLLQRLEQRIWECGYRQIWIETASVLAEAVALYERNGYLPATGVETLRCDRVYTKLLTPSSDLNPA